MRGNVAAVVRGDRLNVLFELPHGYLRGLQGRSTHDGVALVPDQRVTLYSAFAVNAA